MLTCEKSYNFNNFLGKRFEGSIKRKDSFLTVKQSVDVFSPLKIDFPDCFQNLAGRLKSKEVTIYAEIVSFPNPLVLDFLSEAERRTCLDLRDFKKEFFRLTILSLI